MKRETAASIFSTSKTKGRAYTTINYFGASKFAADKLGDSLPRRQGRTTLNPMAHADPIGTIALPLLGVPFGWAKPVPVNPARCRGVSMRTALIWISAAGPISNGVLAGICIGGYALAARAGASDGILHLLGTGAFMNVLLGLFNLLPIPPLDGSRIVDGLLPDRFRAAWNALQPIAPLALVAILALPFLTGYSLFQAPIEWTHEVLQRVSGRG